MADITLSKAVRSNLLNLQSTANLMGKTQERLATGLKVNSALDNPTNFFTASSLNSRAGDLSQLLDSVSNAVQTLSAADKGISAITKLVETAQATARQALQTAATVEQTTVTGGSDATSASVSASAFSTVDVSNAGSAAQNAEATASDPITPIDLTGAPAENATVTAGSAYTPIDASGGDITFDVNGETVTLSQTGGTNSDGVYTLADIIDAINTQVGGSANVTAGEDTGALVLTSTGTAGLADTINVDNFSAGDATDLGFATASVTVTGADANPDPDLTFEINGQTVTLAGGASYDGDAIANAINSQIGGTASVNAVYSNDALVITSTGTAGLADTISIDGFSSGDATQLGFAGATVTETGDNAVAADSISFTLSIDGVDSSITIDAAAATNAGFDANNLSAANIAALINTQAGASVASVDGDTGNLVFTSGTTGTGSTVQISDYTAGVSGGDTGIANASDQGDAAVAGTPTTSQVANPKRDELREQYNELLSQIDGLAKDAGFNGVNLLQGDTLKVLFNEDGSSSIDINGTNFDSAGLGLGNVASGGFDGNDDINAVLADLKSGIETLRTQASKFGSQLSVVETRQDFTKNMINVLQTGAADLTLADTNEEAANLLALQTRQQLSSTALSLASQADQQVLRLF